MPAALRLRPGRGHCVEGCVMSHAAVFEVPVAAPQSGFQSALQSAPRRQARGGVLLASLAAAAVTTGLSTAAIGYALTHIPEVDPNADPAPAAAVAAIAAEAPAGRTKLEVLTPPVYGPGVINEAPAVVLASTSTSASAPFVPLKAEADASAVDMGVLAQAD